MTKYILILITAIVLRLALCLVEELIEIKKNTIDYEKIHYKHCTGIKFNGM